MPNIPITITLTEREYNCVKTQLENRGYLEGKDLSENEYLANALCSYAGLKESKESWFNISKGFESQIKSLERACQIHCDNLMSLKGVYNWIKWKFFNKSLVGRYELTK